MSPPLIHLGARGSSPNDKGEWTQTDWDKYCILRGGEGKTQRLPRDRESTGGEISGGMSRVRSVWRVRGGTGDWVSASQTLPFKDVVCWKCWTCLLLLFPGRQIEIRSTATRFMIDSSQIHASLKPINPLKRPRIDETDWNSRNLVLNLLYLLHVLIITNMSSPWDNLFSHMTIQRDI